METNKREDRSRLFEEDGPPVAKRICRIGPLFCSTDEFAILMFICYFGISGKLAFEKHVSGGVALIREGGDC